MRPAKKKKKSQLKIKESKKGPGFLEKLQDLPIETRKLILWAVIIVLGAGLFFWWATSAKQRLEGLKKEGVKEELRVPKSFGQ